MIEPALANGINRLDETLQNSENKEWLLNEWEKLRSKRLESKDLKINGFRANDNAWNDMVL